MEPKRASDFRAGAKHAYVDPARQDHEPRETATGEYPQQLHSIDVVQVKIEDDDVRLEVAERRAQPWGRIQRKGFELQLLGDSLDESTNPRVVIDDEDTYLGHSLLPFRPVMSRRRVDFVFIAARLICAPASQRLED